MCTLTPNSCSVRQRAGSSLQCPRPKSCDADLLCFTRLQGSEGASEEKGCVHQRQETKQKSERRRGVCVCACVSGAIVWVGDQEAVFQAMELRYKKFDITKRSNVLHCCWPEMENL